MANQPNIVEQLWAKADELYDEKIDLQARIGANRRSLRDLDAQGLLSPEDSARLAEHYPVRTRGGSSEAEEA